MTAQKQPLPSKTHRAGGRLLPVLLCLALLAGAVWLAGIQKGQKAYQTSFFTMDTYATLTVYGPDREALAEQAQKGLESMEGLWSVTDPGSEIYRIDHAAGETESVSAETAELLAFAFKMAERTEGAFDPTLYPVLCAWGFTTGQNRIPSPEELEGLLQQTGYERVDLREEKVSLPDGMMLDLGGVAKGFAGQKTAVFLRENGVTSALLDIGGNVQAIGAKPDNTPWQVGLRDPLSDGVLGRLSVTDQAVVTSGAYERFFIGEDKKRYGHILDPSSGQPVDNDLLSVTVIAPDGGFCDALSTALFVMGADKAVSHWRQYRDFDLILVTKEQEIWLTPGAKAAFSLAQGQEGWKLKEISEGETAAGTNGESIACQAGDLFARLEGYTTDSPSFSARIDISDYWGKEVSYGEWETELTFGGDAKIERRSYPSLTEMQEALDGGERADRGADLQTGAVRLLFCSFPTAGIHALDLYHALLEKYASDERPVTACSADGGNAYYFTQEKTDEEGLTKQSFWDAGINLIVKDGRAYALALAYAPKEIEEEELQLYFRAFYRHFAGNLWGWGLDEENLYWIDHESRLTQKEDPQRSFLEVRRFDQNWDDTLLGYFGLLKSAEYLIPLDHRKLSVSFSLEGKDAPEADCYSLLNGYCMDEPYTMTVKDAASGALLQEKSVSLCIELPDTVAFTDLDGDGYSDMKIEAPVHESGMRAQITGYSAPSYLLWDPEQSEFVSRTKKEVENSLLANRNGLTQEEQALKSQRERPDPFAPASCLPAGADPEAYIRIAADRPRAYTVQKGDSLWRISRDCYGNGALWKRIIRETGASQDPNPLMTGETVYLPEILYIRKDPFSRGGLRSEGSFSIEIPDGFSHHFLAPDNVRYLAYEEENVIYTLPVENPTGEDTLADDAQWAAFQREAARCAAELCPGRVSDLRFEKYCMEDGGNLYGYSFFYDAGEQTIEYADYFRLGRDNMAEVIGVRRQEPNEVLRNTARYMAASFTDYGGRPGMGWGEDAGPNTGAEEWDYPYLHNLFSIARQQFGG